MTDKPTIQRLISFQSLLLNFRSIKRVIHIKEDTKQIRENDTEHSYALAMTAWYLSNYFPELDRDKIIRFALAHDLVEIYAGDTFAFADEKTLSAKVQNEQRAARQLQQEWPDFPDMHSAIHDYEARITPEAKFVYALDKIMPMLLNLLNDGYTWHAENLTYDRLKQNKIPKIVLSPELAPYGEALFELMAKHPEMLPD